MHRVALMRGDGIGPEIIDAAVRVIEAAGVNIEWIQLEGGQDVKQKYGTPLPEKTLETYLDCGVGFKGPFAVEMDDEMIRPMLRKNAGSGRVPMAYNSATNAMRRGVASVGPTLMATGRTAPTA